MHKSDNDARDRLYAEDLGVVKGFVFDEKVVDVFPDMINRSVPGYGAIIHMIGQLAARYCQADSRCYDLGCSLGGATFAMAKSLDRLNPAQANIEIVAIDSSQAMIEKLRALLLQTENRGAEKPGTKITLIEDDISKIEISRASVVILNFTLQFIPPDKRGELLAKIARGMLPGGVLVLSEKITFEDSAHDTLVKDMHHYFKASKGYSDLEIAQKRSALENVLLPETVSQHKERLQKSGFKNANLWFQCFNFASLLAFK